MLVVARQAFVAIGKVVKRAARLLKARGEPQVPSEMLQRLYSEPRPDLNLRNA